MLNTIQKSKKNKLSPPAIILVNPQLAQNIGSVARAMKNCGLCDLRLVKPRDGWPNSNASTMAAGADDLLSRAKVFDNLPEALNDISMVVASSARSRDITKAEVLPNEAAQKIIAHANEGGKSGFLFGAEQSGMSNDEISISNLIVKVPLNKTFSSLNLAQAVLIMAWEWRRNALEAGFLDEDYQEKKNSINIDHKTPFASAEERDFFFSRFENLLDDNNFFSTQEMKPSVMNNLKSIFIRAELSKQELGTLNGVVSALERKKS